MYVGRGSQWGNPYRLGHQCSRCGIRHIQRGSTLVCYEQWAREQLAKDPKWLEPLRGQTLECPGCPKGAPTCHGRILEKLLQEGGR